MSRTRVELVDGWEVAGTAPGACVDAGALDGLRWTPAGVPGTVAGAGCDVDLDGRDWWFRVRFGAEPAAPAEEVALGLGGVATVSEVYLNGERVLESESMFAAHEVDVGARLLGDNELAICCRALAPRLRERRRPRARWRTKLVSEPNLRFYRTMLLGRAPGFAPGPTVVGPWRPVWLERRRGLVLEAVRLRARLAGEDGVLTCRGRLRAVGSGPLPEERLAVVVGGVSAGELAVDPGSGAVSGEVPVARPEPWWPHTHGRPALHEVSIGAGPLHRGRVGFRSLRAVGDVAVDGLDLRINGVPVFARGAVWTPLDLRRPHADREALRPVLERVAAGGMNMLRVPGTALYESDAFYDLCDELGILVWQDFMFANLDYPEQDPVFLEVVEREARGVMERLGSRPSLAAVCGGSEVAQQVAMLGLDPALAQGPLYGELLPSVVAGADVDAPYVPSAPWGGSLPFRPGAGIANYYGVGAYLRPLDDARRAGVRFASECLAFANVPDEAALAEVDAPGGLSVGHPAWKAGVPRDAGAGWDFDDVRDHYLRTVFDRDPVALRWTDQERYLELSRVVSGEVMAETFGEWRRAGSTCRGALVLWLKDLVAGAGWGVLDHRGDPKVAYHHLRRALAPVATWTTDEGLGGIAVHAANDRAESIAARLRVALYRDFEVRVEEAAEDVELGPHASLTRDVEALLGRFVDVSWAYRFGPAAQDLVVVSLERDGAGGMELLSQAFRFVAGRPLTPETPPRLGLRATVARDRVGAGWALRVTTQRFAYGVRVTVPGFVPADDAFGVEPGCERVVGLVPIDGTDGVADPPAGVVTALNLAGRIRVERG